MAIRIGEGVISDLTAARLDELITLVETPQGMDPQTRYGVYREVFEKTGLDQMAFQAEVASLKGLGGVGAGFGNDLAIALNEMRR